MTMTLPDARTRNPGAVVVGLTTDQRNELRNGLLWIAAGLTVAGLGVGYVIGKKKGQGEPRRSNPDDYPMAHGQLWSPSATLREFWRK